MRFRLTLSGQDLGFTRLIETEDSQQARGWPYGVDYCFHRGYFCPACGSLWALWAREDSPGLHWQAFNRTCPKHALGAFTGDRPGSLVLFPSDIPVMPRAALECEVLSLSSPLTPQEQ